MTSVPVRRFIKKGGKGGVFFIHGDDPFRKDEAVRALVEAHVDPATSDFNLDVLRGSEVDGEQLASVLATPPMMAEWRVVVVREVEALSASPHTRELLTGLAQAPPAGLAAILVAAVPRGSRARFWTDLKRQARSLELSPLTPDDVPGWLLERAAGRVGVELKEDAAVALAAAVGSDLGVLAHELDKLSVFVPPGRPITRADVEAAAIRLPAQDKWQWLDMVGGRRFQEALKTLPALFAQGESAVGLAAALSGHLLRVGVAVTDGAGALRSLLPPNQLWLARRIAPQALGWTADELAHALVRLLRADRLMKASKVPREALLEEWLLELLMRARAAA